MIISIVNQKGGVGKTTTAVNLAAYLAKLNKRVLLIDLDSQANATSGIGIADEGNASVYDVLINNHPAEKAIKNTSIDGYHIIPSHISLAGASVELIEHENREYKLSRAINNLKEIYDYIFIDCPPSLCLLTINGLVASDKILIPVQSEYYALEGLGQLLNTIGLVQGNLKPELELMGAIITMFDSRNRLSKDVLEELYQYFPGKIFKSVIPRSVRLAEAPSFGKPIAEYEPESKGAKAYERLAREILEMETEIRN
ncbi:chromosome partitioning protein ParA [Candidatus Falkowbacteria bacterium RBG_13_39_14]|uniref:Chromosome partitioning protein ParA n=1 Tax=Candidatus Falkowbacteria bacterium RBG_13_39_14 TaxID=1797985 RepID=A0A1F5S173_9BACT|nr:MAG: chromosome partitioning protein ParA [Candidatus Falkowbacteria bacterium RBG_13_39_14]